MSKKNRRPKLNLRPKEDKQAASEARESKTEQAIRELAHQLFEQKGGGAIDAAIKRMERLLELHDREAEKLLTSEVTNHRWQVSPSMVIRLQREVEREEERRQALREECWAMARQMVLQWMQDQKAQQQEARAAAHKVARDAVEHQGRQSQPIQSRYEDEPGDRDDPASPLDMEGFAEHALPSGSRAGGHGQWQGGPGKTGATARRCSGRGGWHPSGEKAIAGRNTGSATGIATRSRLRGHWEP